MRSLLVLAILVAVIGLAAQAGPAVSIQSIRPLGEDEVVTIVNLGNDLVDLSGWRLESSNSLGQDVKETFWFPRGCLLPAHGVLRIHSGPYAQSWGDRSCGRREIDLPWTGVEVWNDKADVAWFRDASGRLIDLYTYTAPETEAPPPPRPSLRPKPRSEGSCRWPGPEQEPQAEAERYCPPCPTASTCCAVRVVLESIAPVYNHGVGENWRFYALAGPVEPRVFPGDLPRLIYEDRFRGELLLELGAGATEQDDQPDRGWATRTVRLCCPPLCQAEETITIDVPVRENEGCYTGCTALWRFTFKVSVTPGYLPTRRERPAPQAEFSFSPPGEHRVGDVVTLDASSSRGEGLSYEWDFNGDGQADATGV
ncbi:MAG: lamin tail domain-containing protein, partial [Candidatus Bipolaricaulia bacterium]